MSKILIAGLISVPLIMVLAVLSGGVVDDFKTNSGKTSNKVQSFMDAAEN